MQVDVPVCSPPVSAADDEQTKFIKVYYLTKAYTIWMKNLQYILEMYLKIFIYKE